MRSPACDIGVSTLVQRLQAGQLPRGSGDAALLTVATAAVGAVFDLRHGGRRSVLGDMLVTACEGTSYRPTNLRSTVVCMTTRPGHGPERGQRRDTRGPQRTTSRQAHSAPSCPAALKPAALAIRPVRLPFRLPAGGAPTLSPPIAGQAMTLDAG